MMKQYFIVGTTALILLSSCGASHEDKNAVLNDKKTELEKLKTDKEKIDGQIKDLQIDIDKLDTTASTAQKAKLVSVQTLQVRDFNHFIQLQGHIDALNISYIAPRGNPGLVKEIYVKQGDQVKKGQLLLKLDDAVMRQNYNASEQNLETIKTQLAYAKDIYQRQQNLWSQNIGTEVQLITAKNNVATLENQLKAADENAKTVLEQVNTANVMSDVDGVADLVTIREGEIFGAPGSGVIKIVNNSALKVTTVIPQNYLSNVNKGSDVIVVVPDINKTFNTTVSFVSASIDAINNGFVVEAKLPVDASLKPNQVAEMKIKDYTAKDAIVVPVSTLQNDLTGKFIMVATTENGKLIARKRPVTIGMFNDDQLEIKSCLKAGDVLITEGFQGLYDGQLITTQ
jgi:membrane fusion protein (multidrug efflux system)